MKKLLALLLCLILCLSLFACNKAEEPTETQTETEIPTETDGKEYQSFPQEPLGLNNTNTFSVSVDNLSDDREFYEIDTKALIQRILLLSTMNARITNKEEGTVSDTLDYADAESFGGKWCISVAEYDRDIYVTHIGMMPFYSPRGYIYCNDSFVMLVDKRANTKTTYEIIDERYDLDKFLEGEYKALPSEINVKVENSTLVLPDMVPQSIVFSMYGKPDVSYTEDLDSIYGILKGFTDVKKTDSQPRFDYFGGPVEIGMHVKFENYYISLGLHTEDDYISIGDQWYEVGDSEQLHKLIDIAKGRKQE